MWNDVKKVLWCLAGVWLLLWATKPVERAHAGVTYNFTPSTTLATMQAANTAIASSGGGNTVNFAAGNYTQITTALSWTCKGGNVYQGPAVGFTPRPTGTGVSPTAKLLATYVDSNLVVLHGDNTYTTPGSGCIIQYLDFDGQNVYVPNPASGYLFQYDAFTNIQGYTTQGGNNTSYAGIFLDGGGSTSDQAYGTIQWSTFGPNCQDIDATTTDGGGTCGGIVVHGSNVNLTIQNNNTNGQVEEFLHTQGQGTTGSQVSVNLTVRNNDCNFVHRICAEFQQQQVSGFTFYYNDDVSFYNAMHSSFGYSFACCSSSGGSASPGYDAEYNIVANDQTCSVSYCMGYGFEAGWGNQTITSNNVVQMITAGLNYTDIEIGGSASHHATSPVVQNNIVQGPGAGIGCENGGTLPTCTYVDGTPVVSGNTIGTTPAAVTSASATISLASGSYSYPQTVTLTNSGVNTSMYYTVDGSTPVPGSGTTQLYTGPITVASPLTLKAVGMWGAGANPYSYPANMGYVPSSVATATYALAGTPTLNMGTSLVQGKTSIQ